jgi:hypothetical protein
MQATITPGKKPKQASRNLTQEIEGALAALLFTAVALQARLVVICPPGTNIVALTSGTLEGTIFPPQRMDVRLTLVDVEELVNV